MTANLIGTPIGYPIASHRGNPNRGRIGLPIGLPIAPIVSARIDPSMSYGSLSSGEMSLASHPCFGSLAAAIADRTFAVACKSIDRRWLR